MAIELIIGAVLFVVFIIMLIAMYRIVPPTEAHIVVGPSKKMVCAADEKVSTTLDKEGNIADQGSKWYFHIPIIRTIRKMDITIKELLVEQETYEKNQARYMVKSSTKYRIKDVQRAAETFVSDSELQKQLNEVVRASVRAVTVKFDVVDARALKTKMTEEIQTEMQDDLEGWGLELINFQLVDFQDTEASSVISDISERREKEIQAQTREQVAEKEKQAKIKEAESDEKAQEREIARDKVVGERKQEAIQAIKIQEKVAKEKELEVTRVQQVKTQQIEKEKMLVEANQRKEIEKINMEQKRLEGTGDRDRDIEQAKGEAAPIREKGFAEAEAKEKLQAALNKFKPEAIRALVAEQVVTMQEKVGVAGAEALSKADVRLFGGGEDKGGFDVGKFVASMGVANEGSAQATLNKLARPNDLGFSALGLKAFDELQKVAGADGLNESEIQELKTTLARMRKQKLKREEIEKKKAAKTMSEKKAVQA